jgi:hypothetical protein
MAEKGILHDPRQMGILYSPVHVDENFPGSFALGPLGQGREVNVIGTVCRLARIVMLGAAAYTRGSKVTPGSFSLSLAQWPRRNREMGTYHEHAMYKITTGPEKMKRSIATQWRSFVPRWTSEM